MNNFLLKDDEIMIFTDFNNTLVDYENEYNFMSNRFDQENQSPYATKNALTRCLDAFKQTTGLSPVICIVTNASARNIDANSYMGISQDLKMTFFDHSNFSDEQTLRVYQNSCEKYFRFLIYKENDVFFHINPMAKTHQEMFVPYEFSQKAQQIKLVPQFKKRESIERMLTVIDPEQNRIPFAIFAGDSIKDDYPMMLANTSQGTSKIFIRPGRAKQMKPSVAYEFCTAKGIEFSSVHPKTDKKIKCFDEQTVKFLNEQDKFNFEHFSEDGIILLTPQNSRGLIEGLNKAAEIIKSQRQQSLQMGE